MIAQARFNRVRWMLFAVLALPPGVALAQQDKAPQDLNLQGAQVKAETAQSPAEPQSKTGDVQAQTEAAQAQTQKDPKVISGMSILGNQEAPKALVIVPWKQSGLGNGLSISTMLDDSKLPIDKEVFMRMLNYYEIRSETAPGGASAERNAAQPVTAAQRRNP